MKMLLGFAAGAAAGAALAYYCLRHCWQRPSAAADAARTRLAQSRSDGGAEALLLAEQLSRNRLYFGEAAQDRLQAAFVVVVGLGGVGSHAAHMLARAGVGRLRLLDFDNVTLSSLNRHAVATRDDVGRPKVQVCADHFRDFVPSAKIEAVGQMFTTETADAALSDTPDFIVDAIDDLNTKADLLIACYLKGLRVVSSLGAAAKADPTRLRIGDMQDPVRDPLVVKLRWCLRKRLAKLYDDDDQRKQEAIRQILLNTKVIYSCEEAQGKLAELTEEQAADPAAFGALPYFRLRVLPVLGTMPALVGIAAAAFILSELGGKPLCPHRSEPASHKTAHRLHNRLVEREKAVYGNSKERADPLPICDQNEVSHVLEDVWGSRSAFNGTRNQSHTMTLTRFDRSKPALPYNLVLLLEPEAEWLEAQTAQTGTLPVDLVRRQEPSGKLRDGSPAPSLQILLEVQAVLARYEAMWSATESRQQQERRRRMDRLGERHGVKKVGGCALL